MDNLTQRLIEELANNKNSFDEAVKAVFKGELQKIINEVLIAELTGYLGFEKNVQGMAIETGNSRNGFYKRTILTSFGAIEIEVPRDRKGLFTNQLFERRKRESFDISSIIIKLYQSGLTDSEISEIVEALYAKKYSKSTISNITDAIKEDVDAFKKQKLDEKWIAIFLDSTYVPLRRDSVVKEAINIPMGINSDGERKIIGYSITPSESSEEWDNLLRDFQERGLKEVEIIVTDGVAGISNVLTTRFPKAKQQRCFLHLARNVASKVRKTDKPSVLREFMDISKAETKTQAIA